MRQRRRRFPEEINLTPLLDVLFAILFIVMLTGAQSERLIKQDIEASAAEIESLETQVEELTDAGRIAKLEERIRELEAELARLRNTQASEDAFEADAVIVTMDNDMTDGYHILRFFTGQDAQLLDTVRMGEDRTEYIYNRVTDIVTRIAEEAQGRPVYIVFHCNADKIYRTEEYMPIRRALEQLKKEYKEVFYQITEV